MDLAGYGTLFVFSFGFRFHHRAISWLIELDDFPRYMNIASHRVTHPFYSSSYTYPTIVRCTPQLTRFLQCKSWFSQHGLPKWLLGLSQIGPKHNLVPCGMKYYTVLWPSSYQNDDDQQLLPENIAPPIHT